MTWLRIVAVAIAAMLALAPMAKATTVKDSSLDTQAAAASSIFRGTVKSVTELMLSGTRGAVPHTEIAVRVSDWLKGAGPRVVTFRVPGGHYPDGSKLVVEGLPAFAAGDDVCLLLSDAVGLRVPIVGINRGYYRLETRAGEREPRVFDRKGHAISGVDGRGRIARSNRSDQALSWSQFRAILAGYSR